MAKIIKFGIAFIGGVSLGLLSVMAISNFGPTLRNTSVAESTSLFGMPTPSRLTKLPMTVSNLPGVGPWKELALAGIADSGRCGRDASMNAENVKTVMANMNSAARAEVTAKAEDLLKAGQTQPLGFWDPAGISTEISEGRLMFFREAEIKHGRVCMMAFLGFMVGENYHPLLGGESFDGPAVQLLPVVQSVPLPDFWPLAFFQTFFAIGYEEFRTGFPRLEGTAFMGAKNFAGEQNTNPEPFVLKSGLTPGDIGFDPFGLKPKTEKDLVEMQNKELNNGRLAMFAALGIMGQELVTGEKVFR